MKVRLAKASLDNQSRINFKYLSLNQKNVFLFKVNLFKRFVAAYVIISLACKILLYFIMLIDHFSIIFCLNISCLVII
jgi:hypothetical protein